MAILPTRILEIEFDAGVWTNVTADLVSLSTRRGRNKESGAFETGTMVFTLRNDTRKYDPDYAAGTYYGKLRPNRRVRLRATYSAVTYDVFLGYLDRITQQYGGPNDATAEFQVSDLFKLLNRAELPISAYAAEVADTTPTHWWPMDDPAGATSAIDAITGGYRLTTVGAPSFGAASLPVRDPGGAISFPSANDGIFGVFSGGTFPITTAGTIEYWYRKDTIGSKDPVVGLYVFSAAPYGVDPVSTTSGIIRFFITNAAGTLFDVQTTGVNMNDAVAHHIALTWSAGTNIKIYVDGVDRTSAAVAFSGTMANSTDPWAFAVNAMDYPPIVSVGNGSIATYDEIAIYNTALSAATVAAHNTAGRTPWNGDTPGARLARIFDAVGNPGTYSIDTGEPTLQATSLGGSALAYAQKVEETSLGFLFVAADGTVTFIGRRTAQTGAYLTSQATLVDDDSGAGVPYRSVSADVDEARIVSRATVSREGSVSVTYADSAAIGEFQIVDETHDGLLHDSDDYSLYYAQWIVNTHKTPSSRVGTVALELTKDPATMYPAILALELAESVTYKRKPQNVGAVVTLTMRVEAISHDTGAHYWRTSLLLSPFNLAAGGLPVGVWDTSLWDQAVWSI